MPEEQSHPTRTTKSVDEARSIILGACSPLEIIEVPLVDALGLTLATSLTAVQDAPPFATAAMDGFAVRSEDLEPASVEEPVPLLVAGVQKAGDTSVAAMPPGTAVRIMTGAPCPPGADAVVPFEQTSGDEDVISVSQMVAPGTNIRPIGEEYRAGDELLAMGTVLRPAHLALLAANGRAHVSVRRAARVAVIAAGNELREPGQPLGPGQIWESNSIMVTSLGGELGAEIATAVVVPDQESEIQTALERAQAAQADLVVTVGGISAGDYDLLKQVLAALGNVELWDVAMRPGRPLAFGRISGVPVIGLPGNPAAAFVSFHQFVRPLLARLMGRDERLPTVTATSLESFQNRFGRRNFVRVVVERHEGRCVARSAGSQGTASILSLARANGLLAIPESVELVEAGESVEVQLLGGGEHYGNVVSMRNQRQASRHAAERGQGMT